MTDWVRNTVILALIFTSVIYAIGYYLGGDSTDNATDSIRVDVWHCQDTRSPANFAVFVKSDNGGAENIMLRNDAGDIQCFK